MVRSFFHEEDTFERSESEYDDQLMKKKIQVDKNIPESEWEHEERKGIADIKYKLRIRPVNRKSDQEPSYRAYRITHRQPGLRSVVSRSLAEYDLPPLASSSSTTSCGLTVM